MYAFAFFLSEWTTEARLTVNRARSVCVFERDTLDPKTVYLEVEHRAVERGSRLVKCRLEQHRRSQAKCRGQQGLCRLLRIDRAGADVHV